MAQALAAAGVEAIFSYAGRVGQPKAQPIPTRVGGFGGVAGLVAYLRQAGITHVVDATHPFAATMSAHAVAACADAGVALMALERPPWPLRAGWQEVADMDGAAAALPRARARVFLAIGRQGLGAFAGLDHDFLIRVVEPPRDLPIPARVEVARGPFTVAGDRALMRRHGTQVLVAKNAGGQGARAKLDAAGALGVQVILIARPVVPARARADSPDAVMRWIHDTARGV